MSTSLWANLCALTHIEPDSPGALDAVHAAVNQVVGRGTIQRIREGTPPRVATLDKLAARLRVTPAQLLGDLVSTSDRPATYLAHDVSQASAMVPPQTLVWEDLVRDQLKGLFVLAIKGDALVPNYLPGQAGIWQAGSEARAGQPVLVWLPGDRFEPRIYEDRGNTWAGVALKPGHRTLTPEDDGAEVVARLKYLDLD